MECSTKGIYLYQYIAVIRDALALGKSFRLDVIGESMSPTLVEGDRVVLSRADKILKGDIILYPLGDDSFALHRVLKVASPLVVAGDNNIARERVDASAVVAKVTAIEKGDKVIARSSMRYKCYHLRSSIRRFFRRVKRKISR